MPVQSKIIAGRARKPPPIPGKPILKKNSTSNYEGATGSSVPNGSVFSPKPYSPTKTKFSVVRRPLSSSPKVGFCLDNSYEEQRSDTHLLNGTSEHLDDDVFEDARKGDEASGGDIFNISEEVSTKTARTARFSLSGSQAIKECEEHTDWANDILKRNDLPLISDLRKSIGDGFTLPTILEIISGKTLHCLKQSPTCKEVRIENLRKCLVFLCQRGVDISGIDPKDLEDGDLKTSLRLLGNVRKHFEKTYNPGQNGHVGRVADIPPSEPDPPQIPPRNMPGAMKLPGATPTPFQLGRDTNQSTNRNNLPASPTRKRVVYPDGDLLPGVMGREQNGDHPSSKPHTSLISNTELGTNGVAQHGVEERRAHLASNNQGTSSGQNPNRGILLRHPNAKGMSPTVQETSLPQGVTRAWTGSPRPPMTNGANTGSSVEDRLRQLINSNNKNNNTKNTNTSNGGVPVGQDNQGYNGDGLFHGGGSEVFDDGEILVVPPPKSRNSPDFEVTLGDHSYGPGYRHPGDHQQQRGQRNQGYVPSKPADKRQGSRVDAILDRQSRPNPVARARQHPAAQTIPGMAAGEGTDNFAFTHDTPPTNHRNRGGHSQENNKQGVSPRKVDNYDLRNACNRLYGQQNQSYGSSNPQMARGDNLRSSYGPNSQSRGLQNSGQYSVKYTANQPQPPPPYSRPVSAPAPAHMQVHFQRDEKLRGQFPSQDHLDGQGHTVTSTSRRESPMGQSSSTQGHLEESSSSQQSGGSHGAQGFGDSGQKSQGQSDNNRLSGFDQSGPNSPNSPSYAIGPASKYPEHGSRPSSAKKPPVNYGLGSPGRKTEADMTRQLTDIPKKTDFSKPPIQRSHGNVAPSPLNQKKFADNLSSALQNASAKGHHSRGFSFDNSHNTSYDMSHERLMERLHEQSHDIQDQSIFDYDATQSETSGSVTPPLPPLSPTQTPPESPDNSPPLPRSFSATNVSSAEKLHVDDGGKRKTRRTSELQFRMDRKPHTKRHRPRGKFKGGMGLRDVKESGTDTDSNLSFDIDDTILTVDSHDTEQPHPAGDILNSRETQLLRQQLRDLESKYQNLQSKVEKDGGAGSHPHTASSKGPGPPPIGRQRRWSIGSSDTSSFRREAKYKPGRQIIHKHHSKEFKNINKRFQRLESHVVTLARSVAHLSSELRTHNTMVNDLESVKKELRELRDNPGRPWPSTLKGHMMDYSGSRGFVPSLTNPKRVNKLTKFFGAEPPLLEFFLQELGYQKYIPNFKTEHIGMIELPYMTEDRLEKIGVPMGPRLRILQEARVCFQQENLDVYIV